MTRWLKRLAVVVLVLLVGGAGVGVWGWYAVQAVGDETLAVDGDASTLMVERGDAFRVVAARMAEQGLVERPRWLRLHARLTGQASRLQAGEYRFTPGTTVSEALTAMARGDVVRYRFTIVEGWTFRELLTALAREPALKHTLDGLSDDAIMARLGAPEQHPEGRFLPETYQFTRGSTDLDLLRRAFRAMEQELARTWAERDEDLPLDSPYEALILASIVEKETGAAGERRRIAGVFTRRLQRGMRLQTDPTVIYGMGDAYDGDIRYRDLRRDTPYNTYTRHGLPPTPIALPGSAALRAAVQPAEGDSLYFVSRGDGTHKFSVTLEEHNRAVRRYQLD